jgi:hypothetical protein
MGVHFTVEKFVTKKFEEETNYRDTSLQIQQSEKID